MAVVRSHFRPEFLNRIDDLIVFHRLTRDDLRKIVEIQLALVQDRLAERAVTLAVSDAGLDWLADHGYDPAYGARPLKRLIQTAIANPLAIKLLEGAYPEGSTIQVDVDKATN